MCTHNRGATPNSSLAASCGPPPCAHPLLAVYPSFVVPTIVQIHHLCHGAAPTPIPAGVRRPPSSCAAWPLKLCPILVLKLCPYPLSLRLRHPSSFECRRSSGQHPPASYVNFLVEARHFPPHLTSPIKV
jgi:hypothetical protein